ncbi:RagB/SusD family nutrient uptake outer membrane protein [Chitinophaga sp. XS-30]|uniref:RagB/SusD family nutrient uptake outer membrane protein n=1 Tax=Chitinophaga sp. XS-30 TaxID=2604421 RepID=UPI0011DD7980|nr:RagB/SusD family nutrient uptake outer membrane protein [Chitinophaga sp. XS-30]QEH43826.1 RagB/SusD family nutrient uptake outer membrane protein [Chitinophaga sp. XS-30]
MKRTLLPTPHSYTQQRQYPLLRRSNVLPAVSAILVLLCCISCRKLLTVPPPVTQVTAEQVFSTDEQANSAMAGIYVSMIGVSPGTDNFANGLTSRLGGLSSDELVSMFIGLDAPIVHINTNKITRDGSAESSAVWKTLYATIYGANAVIDGVAGSTSSRLSDSTRKQLTAEAKCIRAFCYFYLVNFFGDVPLVLVADPLKVAAMSRTPVEEVYRQIIQDLKDAQTGLVADYSASNGKRIRVNMWGATALLARAYLFLQDYDNAAAEATKVIGNTSEFDLEDDLNRAFLTDSKEAIWQLEQNINDGLAGNATLEGYNLLPIAPSFVVTYLSEQLLGAFEPGDQRRAKWVDSTGFPGFYYYYPAKYKTGALNRVVGAPATEYYMLLRLAEQYLIRAEARAHGAPGGAIAAIADLNALRSRSGLDDLPETLSETELLDAVAKEWQTEMFCEWGHRWFNLKRTGKAPEVLSAIPIKQPWVGDYQLLYPLPLESVLNGAGIIQNSGYQN